MKRFTLIAFASLLLGTCNLPTGRFKRFDRTAPADLVPTAEARVMGEDCQVFIPLLGVPTLENAVKRAIQKAPPGTTGLKDAIVSSYYSALIGELCWKVDGIPVK